MWAQRGCERSLDSILFAKVGQPALLPYSPRRCLDGGFPLLGYLMDPPVIQESEQWPSSSW